MDEAAFLENDDPAAYERPSGAVDMILMSVIDGALAVLLTRRDQHPFAATWALPDGDPLQLAFDHGEMLGLAVRRLRGKRDYSGMAFALLPERFTLRALQDIHETILATRLDEPAFRRRMLDRGWLEAAGERETGASFRPAEPYRHRQAEGKRRWRTTEPSVSPRRFSRTGWSRTFCCSTGAAAHRQRVPLMPFTSSPARIDHARHRYRNARL